MQPVSEEDLSPFTEKDQIIRSMQSALGTPFSESDLSKATLEKIDNLVSLKLKRRMRHVETWNYFTRVHRYWILFFGLLIVGIVLLPLLIGIIFIGFDAFLYRWIRKRERTTPQSSFDAIELGNSYITDLKDVYDRVKVELSARGSVKPTEERTSIGRPDLVGRAIWIEMDADHSTTVFRGRKGIVVRIFSNPPSSCKEALVVELASPPLTFSPIPRRIRYLIAEYYQKWDSIQYTFDSGYSFVRFLRLKNRAVLTSHTYARGDASAIGYGILSGWPVPSSDVMLLRKQMRE